MNFQIAIARIQAVLAEVPTAQVELQGDTLAINDESFQLPRDFEAARECAFALRREARFDG